MADEFDDLEELEPSALRKKLEAAIKTNKTLTEENSKFKAKDVIEAKGFTLVKPEDLAGVALDKIEEHAEKLHTERKQVQADLAKDIFERQGLEGEELDQAVETFMAGKVPEQSSPGDDAARRFEGVRALDRENATPVSQDDASKLHGKDAIAHGLAAKAKKSKRPF